MNKPSKKINNKKSSKPHVVNYVYLSSYEAKELVAYINEHKNRNIVIRMMTGGNLPDSNICNHIFAGCNSSFFPGYNPSCDSNPIDEKELIDPDAWMYC